MVEIFKCEEKNKDDALIKCLNNMGKTTEEIYFKTREIEGRLFKSKKTEVIAIKKDDVIKYIKEYINDFSKLINIDIKSEVKEKEDVINIILVTDNNAIMIGKDGRTLNALQTLLRQAIKNETDFNIKINLDVSNYKNKKLKNLEYEIRKIVKEVINTKIEAKLDPMNSYERRMVHTVVGEFSELETESEGEEPNRFVIISYKK